jgi:hypothetical protein
MLAARKASEYTLQSSCTNMLQNELAKKHTIPGSMKPVAQSHAPHTASSEGKFFILTAVGFLSFPQSICHLVAPTRLDAKREHNTFPRFTVAMMRKKIPSGLVANLMRDCVLHKVKGMLSKQTTGQINLSVSVKAAACRSFQPCIKRDGGAGFRQPRINPNQVCPGFGHGFSGQ